MARVKPGECRALALVLILIPVSTVGDEDQSGEDEAKEYLAEDNVIENMTRGKNADNRALVDLVIKDAQGDDEIQNMPTVVIDILESLPSLEHRPVEEDIDKLVETFPGADCDQSKASAAFVAVKASDNSKFPESLSTSVTTSPSLLPATSDKRRFFEAASCARKTDGPEGQSSSVGSSLVGQSVGSWLATTSDSLDQSSGGRQSEGADLSFMTREHSDGINDSEQLSDYILGSEGILKSPGLSLEQEELPGHKTPSRVTFSPDSPRQFPTHSVEDYDRRNEWVDPAAASVEWEQEKRLERLHLLTVELVKGEQGLGLSILGMGTGAQAGGERLGVYVKGVTPGGKAERDGRMMVGDQILSVNGLSLVGVTQEHAALVLRGVTGRVQFLVGREETPEVGEVARLMREQVDERDEVISV